DALPISRAGPRGRTSANATPDALWSLMVAGRPKVTTAARKPTARDADDRDGRGPNPRTTRCRRTRPRPAPNVRAALSQGPAAAPTTAAAGRTPPSPPAG